MEDVLNMPLITVQEGTRLGRIIGAELDTVGGWVRFLRFQGEDRGPTGLIPWTTVQHFGTDAVTVTSSAEVTASLRQGEKELLSEFVGDRPVVTESGKELGRIVDYTFDEETGKVLTYSVETRGLFSHLLGRKCEFAHAAIRAFGKDAVVVSDEVVSSDKAA